MKQNTIRWLVLFVVCCLSSSLFAQTAAAIRGRVIDELGAAILGAQVTLTSAAGKRSTAATNAKGEFTIYNLEPGIYTLIIQAKGFQDHVEKQMRVPLTSSPLKVTMAVAAVKAATDVHAQSGESLGPDQNRTAAILNEDFIKTLPDNEEDLRAYLEMLAGPAAGGQGGTQILVDGFSSGPLPPRESIVQIRINLNPFSSEFSSPGISRIEIITKPGGDRWRASAGIDLRNSAIDARNAFALTKPDLDQKRYLFDLGGPIIRKKMSFLLSGERKLLDASSVMRAQTLSGPFIANVPAPSKGLFLNGRSDYLFNNRHTLNLNYFHQNLSNENVEFAVRFLGVRFGGGIGGPRSGFGSSNNFYLPERASSNNMANHTLRLSETFVINSRLVHEARWQFQSQALKARAKTEGLAVNVLDAFYGGGSPCCPNERQSRSIEYQDYLTYADKNGTIKAGFQIEYEKIHDLNASNFNGTYTFSSLEQYRQVLNREHVVPNDPASPLVRPAQFTINRGNPLLGYSRYQASWFIQSDSHLSQTLTLSLGLRHEFQNHLSDKINFAPRLNLAWSPFRDHKTMIRVGGGIFYDRLSGNLYEISLRYDGLTQESLVIRAPLFPDPFVGNPTIDRQGTITRILDPHLKAPYLINCSVDLERQLPRGLVTTVSYIHTTGIHQFRSRNINAPLPETSARPNPQQGNIYQIESSARAEYNGWRFGLNRRFGKRLLFFGSYTLSWANNDTDGALSLPANNYELRSEWGPSSFNRRHLFVLGSTLTLPHNFRVGTLIAAGSGRPFNVTTGRDDNNDTQFNDRPSGITRNADLPPGIIPAYPHGLRAVGPGIFNVDLTLNKTFGFGQRKGQPPLSGLGGQDPLDSGLGRTAGGREPSRFTLTLSVKITNLFNRVNFGQYSGVLTSPFFGRPNSANPARQFESGIRFGF